MLTRCGLICLTTMLGLLAACGRSQANSAFSAAAARINFQSTQIVDQFHVLAANPSFPQIVKNVGGMQPSSFFVAGNGQMLSGLALDGVVFAQDAGQLRRFQKNFRQMDAAYKTIGGYWQASGVDLSEPITVAEMKNGIKTILQLNQLGIEGRLEDLGNIAPQTKINAVKASIVLALMDSKPATAGLALQGIFSGGGVNRAGGCDAFGRCFAPDSKEPPVAPGPTICPSAAPGCNVAQSISDLQVNEINKGIVKTDADTNANGAVAAQLNYDALKNKPAAGLCNAKVDRTHCSTDHTITPSGDIWYCTKMGDGSFGFGLNRTTKCTKGS